jgi:NADH:ubiquinone oxidoreductase subunit F (NADH-binding)/Pyruvate/2-oxoacid:ferredoxin oxidoreductase delta subunit/(2Fe-2S) ferredoxin
MNKEIEIRVCTGTGGIAAGSLTVFETFQKILSEKNLTACIQNNCYSHKVGCRGLCARDVLVDVIINGEKTTYQYVKPEMVERIIEEHLINGSPISEWVAFSDYQKFYEKQTKIALSNCGEIDPESIGSYISVGGYKALEKTLKNMSPEAVIEEVKRSGLRGRGGAGFPTGIKWEIARNAPQGEKYVICNAGEGHPIIDGNPHSVIEGMLISGYAIGAKEGYVYIRTEFALAVERTKKAIEEAKNKNLIGKDILGTGFDFDIKIKLGAGAFICGEETALIASIEGKRGMPRAKPPFPAQKGLFGKPTVVNNVETFANIPYIITRGAEWFASYGTEKSKGTKVFSLTGKVKNTGLIEVPFGIPLREIIYDIGGGIKDGGTLKAVHIGGPSGGCIPEELIDIPIDYESLANAGSIIGSGEMIVLNETDCMVNVAQYFLQFTQSESCGKCVPCRIGTKRLLEILKRITSGRGKPEDIEKLEKLSRDIKASSLCGLGQTAPNPVLSTLHYFRNEYEAHIHDKRCPAGVCKDLITYTIIEEFCKGCGMCLRVCPSGAIVGEKKKPHKIIPDICIKCGACFEVCKFKAIRKG